MWNYQSFNKWILNKINKKSKELKGALNVQTITFR